MTTKSHTRKRQYPRDLKQAGDTINDSSSEALNAIRAQTDDLLACASESIRKNPVPIVVGALALGITVGCLLMTGRNPSVIDEDLLADAGDSLSNSFSSLLDHLKFW